MPRIVFEDHRLRIQWSSIVEDVLASVGQIVVGGMAIGFGANSIMKCVMCRRDG